MLKNYWSQLWCGVPHTGHLTEEKLVCREVVHLPGGSKGAENSPCLPFLGRMSAPGIQEETGKEKKKPSVMLKVGEADFLQFYRDSYRDHCNGVF